MFGFSSVTEKQVFYVLEEDGSQRYVAAGVEYKGGETSMLF